MDVERIAAKYALGDLPLEHLPDVAADALEAGYDPPSLRRLAGSHGGDREEMRRTFEKTLRELGVRIPSQQEAVLSVARDIAQSVLEGQIAPSEAAKRIWWDLYVRFGQPEQLRPFVGFASEYEDRPKHRDEYARLIIEECERILRDTN